MLHTVNLYMSLRGATRGHDGVCPSIVSWGVINHQKVFSSFTLNSISRSHPCWNLNTILQPERAFEMVTHRQRSKFPLHRASGNALTFTIIRSCECYSWWITPKAYISSDHDHLISFSWLHFFHRDDSPLSFWVLIMVGQLFTQF